MHTLHSPRPSQRFVLRRFALRVIVASMLVPPATFAQQAWDVGVKPTMDPLPIGFCGAVHVSVLDPGNRDVPRNALGARVTIADFDLTVTTPDGVSVVGRQIDASHWSACACQGALAGTVATVTATYPARALAEASRVAGVALQKTATFTLAAPKGTANPAECSAPLPVTMTGTAAAPLATAVPARTATPQVPAPAAGTTIPTQGPPVGQPLGAAGRSPAAKYKAAPVIASFTLGGTGSWYVAAPVIAQPSYTGQGSWYVAAPLTATFTMSGTGNWIETIEKPVRPSPRPLESP